MFVTKKVWDLVNNLKVEASEALGRNSELVRRCEAQQTTLDWLTMRVTQLEKERAQLLFMYTGVKVETPVIGTAPTSPIPQNAPLDALPNFDDMGDEAAKKLGIDWDADGRVKYA